MIDLKARREKAGLTQYQLSEVSGVKRSTIAMIETDVNSPSVETAKALAEVLGFEWFEFYEEGSENDATNGKGSSVTLTN